MTRGAAAVLVVALAASTLLLVPRRAAAQYQPHLAFRVLATPHFRVYYHQGEEPLARRLAAIAESVRETLPSDVRLAAPPLTHVVLSNQDDEANGWATPVPYCVVGVNAAWPELSSFVGNSDDWLRLVFVHEYVHILQLNQSVGWAAVAKAVFGRAPIAFPNVFLPAWQIEGFATYWETRATGLGRVNGGDTAAVVRNRATTPGSEPLDRINGGSVEWPGPLGPYLEGAWFYDYLYRQYGDDAVGRLAMVTAGRFPYFGSQATKRVFGQSLGTLWSSFQREVAQNAPTPPVPSPEPRRLTRRGFQVSSPRFDASGRTLVYGARDPDGYPTLRLLDATTGLDRPLAGWFGGTQVSVGGGLVFFDQLELEDNVAWRSDLYAADLDTHRTTRLTSGERLLEPDVTRDGQRLACVRVAGDGRRDLAFFAVARTASGTLALEPMTVPVPADGRSTFGAPRWSPDGRLLAIERRRSDGPSEIVVFDVDTGAERVVASTDGGRSVSPTWAPDGRTVLFASDRAERSFQIYAASVEGTDTRRVTGARGGAMSPEISPDGRTLVFVGSDESGYDLFAVEIVDAVLPGVPRAAETPDSNAALLAHTRPKHEDPERQTPTKALRYSPFPTLLPRAWTPYADSRNGGLRAGITVGGEDVLRRHALGSTVLWRFSETTAVGGSQAGRPDWNAFYTYARWLPAFYVSASDTTSFISMASPGAGVPDAELREQIVAAGVQVPLRRVRRRQLWQVEFDAERETRTWKDAPGESYRNALRAAWTIDTTLTYGRSISRENGIAAGVTTEQVRSAFGADGDADAYTAEIRAYWRPGRTHAVLAGRAGYGASTGDSTVRRRFFLGGASSAGGLVNYGSDALAMVRGFEDEVAAGSRIASASLEWRQPLPRVQRGVGTWPIFVRTAHVAVFADAGSAWTGDFSSDRVMASFGLEASIDTVVGFRLPLTFTAGVARTYDRGSRRAAGGFYARIGPSF